MLRCTDIEVAFMVEGGIIDGYVIGVGTKVVAGICYSARLIVIIDDAIHTYDEQGLWTMLYESHRRSVWRFEVFAVHLSLVFDESGKGGEVTALP